MPSTSKSKTKTKTGLIPDLQMESYESLSLNNKGKSDEKELAYYSAIVQAWVGTKMEKDKSLLTLSSFGLGLIGTILTAVGANSVTEIVLYALVVFCFLITIISSIIIFEKNASVIEKEIEAICKNYDEKPNENSNKKVKNKFLLWCDDNLLPWLDTIIFWSFILGLILFLSIGVLSSINKLNKGDKKYEQQEPQINNINPTNAIR